MSLFKIKLKKMKYKYQIKNLNKMSWSLSKITKTTIKINLN